MYCEITYHRGSVLLNGHAFTDRAKAIAYARKSFEALARTGEVVSSVGFGRWAIGERGNRTVKIQRFPR